MAWDPMPLVENQDHTWTDMDENQHIPQKPPMGSNTQNDLHTEQQLMPPPSQAPAGSGKHHYVPHPLYQTGRQMINGHPVQPIAKQPTYKGKDVIGGKIFV